MLMMKIQMNEEKIAAEKRYSAAAIRSTLQAAFEQLQLRGGTAADGTLVYRDSGSEQDYARFGKIVNALKKQPWFMENVSLWRFYDGEDAADCSEEDLLRHYARRVS